MADKIEIIFKEIKQRSRDMGEQLNISRPAYLYYAAIMGRAPHFPEE
jgi:hypothetical protein